MTDCLACPYAEDCEARMWLECPFAEEPPALDAESLERAGCYSPREE